MGSWEVGGFEKGKVQLEQRVRSAERAKMTSQVLGSSGKFGKWVKLGVNLDR